MAQEEPRPQEASSGDSPLVNAALGISALAVVLFVVAIIIDADEGADWLWPVAGIVGLLGAVLGWLADPPRPRGRALIAVVAGGLIFAVILAWAIVALITGNL